MLLHPLAIMHLVPYMSKGTKSNVVDFHHQISNLGPSMLLRTTRAPLDQYFFKNILKSLKFVFQKDIKNIFLLLLC
jgi:hypothetical protein